jgi:hypothetical protein
MADFWILFTITETGYSNRLQSVMRRLILSMQRPLYPIIRANYETISSEQYRWYASQQGCEADLWNNVRRERACNKRLTGDQPCLPTMLRLI